MVEIKLYKNGKLELEKNGKQEGNMLIFDGILYDMNTSVLLKEEEDVNTRLDFVNKKCDILLIKEDYKIDVLLFNVSIENSNNTIKITYEIESEENVVNSIEINY